MDPKEARKFTMSNPPADIQAERRPSLLGRLLRRMSSSEGTAATNVAMGQSFDGVSGERRESITEAIQQQYLNQPDRSKTDPVFNLFT